MKLLIILCAVALSLSAGHVAAQNSPCGNGYVISVPADSPPVTIQQGIGAISTYYNTYVYYSFTRFNIYPLQSWTSVRNAYIDENTVPVPGRAFFASLIFDVSGFPVGTYCANFGVSYSEVTPAFPPDPQGFPWNTWNCPSLTGGYSGVPASGESCFASGTNPIVYQVNVTATSSAILIDPVPALVNGNAVMGATQLQGLLNKGTTVDGVEADGTTQIIVRISTNAPNEQYQVTLLNNQQAQSTLPNEDGALGTPGSTTFAASQLPIQSGSVLSNGHAYAFAVYRAPLDFVRPLSNGAFKSGTCDGATKTDDQATCRLVSIQVKDITNGQNTMVATLPVYILRPPVVAIHGLWARWSDWNNFYPLITGAGTVDPRFYVARVNYSAKIANRVQSTSPTYSSLSGLRANSLGVLYNASPIAQQIVSSLADFKSGHNPMSIAVAGVQVDILAHSLGGLMSRQLVLTPSSSGFTDFRDPTNFMQGYIHKLITLDSPHLGSPLATLLLNGQNTCTAGFLASYGMYSLNSVTWKSGGTTGGAVADLQGDGVNIQTASSALQTLANPGPLSIPVALVGGNYTNWNSLNCSACAPAILQNKCKNDPLAQSFTPAAYPANFPAGSNGTDGVVGVTSQQNGATTNDFIFNDIAHSPGIVGRLGLGFAPPSALDSANSPPPNPIVTEVVNLLNTPITQPPYSQTTINP